ncbi:PglL family O-oligosaccharyltransferase, partial [Serratia marcescens]
YWQRERHFIFICFFLFFIPSAVYIPDSNSSWVVPSFDLLFAVGGALLLAVCWRSVPLRRVVATPTVRGLAGACVLLALPVLFTRPEWQSAAI